MSAGRDTRAPLARAEGESGPTQNSAGAGLGANVPAPSPSADTSAAQTAPRCPESSQEGARCIYDEGHDGKHFAKDAFSYYSWASPEPERRWLAERFLFWIANRVEIAAFALTQRRRSHV